jgi:hypothetical protein
MTVIKGTAKTEQTQLDLSLTSGNWLAFVECTFISIYVNVFGNKQN